MAAERRYATILRRRVGLLTTLLLEQAEPIIGRGEQREGRQDGIVLLDDPWDEPWYADGVVLAATIPEPDEWRADVDSVLVREMLDMVRRLRTSLVGVFDLSVDRVLPIAQGADRHGARVLARYLGRPVSREDDGTAAPVLRRWARQNAQLVSGLDDRILDDIARTVVRASEQGLAARDLGKVLRERVGIAKRRADLIARDQLGSLNGEITKARQTAAGFPRFTWSDSGDSRVRPLHVEINGNVYEWSTGHPTEGIPGQPILCRCVGRPAR